VTERRTDVAATYVVPIYFIEKKTPRMIIQYANHSFKDHT